MQKFGRQNWSHRSAPIVHSPQVAMVWHWASQVVPLGGSQVSPGCTMPSPQTIGMGWHWASQVVPLGGSQVSPGCTMPSPQTPDWH